MITAHNLRTERPHEWNGLVDIYIGRPSNVGIANRHFSNPFSHRRSKHPVIMVPSREAAVTAYEDWVTCADWDEVEPRRREWIRTQLKTHALKDNRLWCWCAPKACHGDVRAQDRLKSERLKMGFCIECHREKKAPLDCWIACHS